MSAPSETLGEHGPEAAAARPRAWIVDDDETALMLAEAILGEDGFAVRSFTSSAEALAAMAVELPDIVVLDVLMPGMNGFELCAELRHRAIDIPVLVATSLEDPRSIDLAYHAGATGFAIKPLNWTVEAHRLRYMLRVAETARRLKEKERETRQAKDDWERTFNSISDSVTVLGLDLKILRANLATSRVLRLPVLQILGRSCHELFRGSGEPCPGCPARLVIATGAPASCEMRYHDPGVDCLLTVAPVMDEGGRLLHLVHIARDLTSQRQLERQYLHAQKMEAIGTLAGGVAHDFNNLLTVISSGAELIRSDPAVAGEHREWADAIFDSAQRGAALSKQLLAFSRKRLTASEKRPLQLNEVVRDLQRVLGRVFPGGIVIRTRCASDLRLVNGSADELHQALMNLAVNASHAMGERGTLEITTENVALGSGGGPLPPGVPPGEFVRLTVSDTGHGMDRQTMERMFEPFFTTKPVGQGTGLGLPVVYGVVDGHGGHIHCSSEPGAGTTFTIHLPVHSRAEEPAQAPAWLEPALRGGREAILVVDDDARIRAVLQTALAKLGYPVIPARDGESALRRFREEGSRIRLIVMDLDMPGMGGWECLKQLRAIDPTVRVLIATGQGDEDIPERVRREGAAGLIAKPFRLEALAGSVREMLDRG